MSNPDPPSPEVAIVGLGVVGSHSLRLFRAAALGVVGYDVDSDVCARYDQPESPCTSDISVLLGCRFVFVNVPTSTSGGAVDRQPLVDFLSLLEGLLDSSWRPIVVVESTLWVGAYAWLAEQLTDRVAGIAVLPHRYSENDPASEATTRVLGTSCPITREALVDLFAVASKRLHHVDDPNIAIASKLMENTQRFMHIQAASVLAHMCQALGLSPTTVFECMDSKFNAAKVIPAYVGGECLPFAAHEIARAASPTTTDSMLALAIKDHASFADRVVAKVQEAAAGTLDSRALWVFGVAYKPGVASTTCSLAHLVVPRLLSLGAVLTLIDSRVAAQDHIAGVPVGARLPSATPAELIVVRLVMQPADHDMFELAARQAGAVIDCRFGIEVCHPNTIG